ncbi:MAG: GNAT family N-acetyltransferase [Candidatus Poribacteria bacterium]|jgi:predicted acetyltransferase|nr:GNAT family N-acetyltransferase [Candidatus Poribacteria bacterium]MDP6751168.1 GNAT family N-acetyltransferase [Candidatus Poribacteria bacterium]MDP6999722.1 GNAT family N-acetyltransferase [Candidatus Poribacteria bacterium]
MKIRSVRPDEIERVIDLQCLAFQSDGRDRYRQYIEGDSSYHYQLTRVVSVEGQIVATLRIWDRRIQIGATTVPMAGIGGVCTDPEHRGSGYGSALMRDTVRHLSTLGYDLGILFTIIPCCFYQRLGWHPLPLSGFKLEVTDTCHPTSTDWQVAPFSEAADLNQVVDLHDRDGGQHSGATVRTRSYWEMKPSRIRGILPTVVARLDGQLGGYLNYEIDGTEAKILEVGYDHQQPMALVALVNRLLTDCLQKSVQRITGDISHQHPIVGLMQKQSKGDLLLTGNSDMMLFAVNLPSLLRRLLPEWQLRLDRAQRSFPPLSLRLEQNNQQAILHLPPDGRLKVFNQSLPSSVPGDPLGLKIPEMVFWSLLFGESSWEQLLPALTIHNLENTDRVSDLMSVLFPSRTVIFWSPDHY